LGSATIYFRSEKEFISLQKHAGENGNMKLYHNAIIYVIKLFHGSIGMCKLRKTVKCNNVSDITISDGLFLLQELYALMLI
jgi:hypothetical protein